MNLKGKCFERPPQFKRRLAMMLIGVMLQGFGLSLLMKLNLGTDPCSALTQGVIRYIPISFGTAQLLCHLVTFAFVLRFDLSQIGFGTIGNMVFLGYIADFFTWIWNQWLPVNFFEGNMVRFGLLIPALAIFIFGAATYMTAGLGSSPYDGLPFIISEHVHKISFRFVRMLWDIAFMAAGALLGGNVGIVTIAVAFFLGPVISWVQKLVGRLLKEQ